MAQSWPVRKSLKPKRAPRASFAFSSDSASPGCSTGTGPPSVTPRAAGWGFALGLLFLFFLPLLLAWPPPAFSSSSLLLLLSSDDEQEEEEGDASFSTRAARLRRCRFRPRRKGP
jgi:hypothetical protein